MTRDQQRIYLTAIGLGALAVGVWDLVVGRIAFALVILGCSAALLSMGLAGRPGRRP
jgi:hypothetical protein